MSLIVVLAALALVQDPAPAQAASSAAQEPPAVALEEVVVEGRRLEELTREFVDEVSAPPRRRGLARWRGGVCVGVSGIRQDIAQAVADHVSRVALAYGLRPGDPGCRANILIVFAEDGQSLGDAMVERRERVFHLGVGGLDRGDVALEDFRFSDRPVRWWHVSVPTNAYTGDVGIRMPGDESSPRIPGEGLLNKGRWLRDDMNKVIIVVDGEYVNGVGLPQLADYLSMVALAQVDPEGDTSRFSTILNLFDDPEGSPGLTGWDRAYLDALYTGPSERIRASDQTRQLLRNLRRARASDAEAGDLP
ncbi:MAG: hypothetical protein QME55_08150 [Brevundimonas sp.]|uniref:hypothetical protein n=1 Tax=Brevundimonas sp. TaxID=1871086 RepID=UPI002619A2C3|nr:hypothetical protein [Brevundimonas sp.]MDI6624687.1 hypothetical protein [Brevundimonas sp.]MDQ7811492.1 hypothetical protein [Brevundimonas sp.]